MFCISAAGEEPVDGVCELLFSIMALVSELCPPLCWDRCPKGLPV